MTPPNKWLFFPTPASSGGSNWSDYMSANSGVGYWIVPDGHAATSRLIGPTGGDSSTNWSEIRFSSVAGHGTTEDGITMSGVNGQWKKGLQGGHVQYSNAYDYVAIGWQSAGSSGYGQAHSAGWIVAGREATAGNVQGARQSYIPIEGTDGLTDSTWAGGGPWWNASGYNDHIVFFMSDYTSGDLAGWTTWDGSTTP